jgi:hypothetical protein
VGCEVRDEVALRLVADGFDGLPQFVADGLLGFLRELIRDAEQLPKARNPNRG